ncbi:tRNA (adenosine(37)-N6)-threonylcarbamoyltransferase complex dimerization subunit type 1 TsaB [Thiocapsa sp.]|uniref:tRNA (adenosine(37)-N6)-threonylcarbamoyltransferase complex dimerization subunit type 1 TsaB n=1 Tax=Thiocapsa sp. TaxID=2024551 RepID=UPI002BBF42EE|nr:tRNA (adenosine(37)-N6)-threonylcarbamoyltransferase complex dimerization subunit type 1 TsaB [Thiocapsa sp.]HSO81719.1 tRNA (adenosine(37)-N6)-threonylcarbamoyltransferase complex dimerization subunit type 1 TsaB [Thiocapsa sp.]
MTTLLAIDTSGDACSAALLSGERIEQVLETAPRRHGELILGMMQQVLDNAGTRLDALDAIAFARGPGSFTGVRIAVAVAQGAAFGAGLPLVPVSTLAAIAQGEFRRSGERRLLVALDARMGEVYWGCFEIDERGLAVARCEERVCPPEGVESPGGEGWFGVGPGWSVYGAELAARTGVAPNVHAGEAICEARDLAVLGAAELAAGHAVPPELAAPVYLRDRVTRVG